MEIIEITPERYEDIVELGNLVHGENYLTIDSLDEMIKKGTKQGRSASFMALNAEGELLGFRTSYSAQQWSIDKWCSPELWPVSENKMAYFKCIAISPHAQGQGIGPKLLEASTRVLKQQGALAGVAHLWKQSPGNGAVKYFTKAGGALIRLHDDRWLENCINEGYHCPLCGNQCHCQAAEMVLTF